MSEEKHSTFVCQVTGGVVKECPHGCREKAAERWEQSVADERLRDAAPELLEALTMVRDADEDCKRDGLDTIGYHARKRIDDAIAKATGAR